MSPSADNSWWSLLDRGGRLETLDRGECRRLLDSTHVGRLAYCTDSGPRILPMNYTLVGERLIFRTGMDTEASSYLINRPIAFQVDQVDEFLQTGWSVLVVGNAGPMDEASLRLLDYQQSPQPWPEGRRSLVVQLPLTTVTGRRVHRHDSSVRDRWKGIAARPSTRRSLSWIWRLKAETAKRGPHLLRIPRRTRG